MLIKLLEHNDPGASMSITLSTSSGVIYGQLVTRQTWKGLWTEFLMTEGGVEAGAYGTFPDAVDSASAKVQEAEGSEQSEGDGLPRFIHLKNVTLLAPTDSPIALPFWRGRLDSVSGWSNGKPTP
ncbi:hypothetical protein ABZ656_29490 [Streptomyces sp. NPDC007095]|uniref:hypothetical protein n=1 Tax=Streptomyces sp. NPDC007095 TaxID=3154482 RepID=UPI0033D62FA9